MTTTKTASNRFIALAADRLRAAARHADKASQATDTAEAHSHRMSALEFIGSAHSAADWANLNLPEAVSTSAAFLRIASQPNQPDTAHLCVGSGYLLRQAASLIS